MEKYKDIIDLPHKQSSRRPHMSMSNRAAQFAPFAALTVYDDAIQETGRLTDEMQELCDETLNALNRKYQLLAERISERQEVRFTYFVPDASKSGGAYVEKAGVVKKVDDLEQQILLCDGTKIPMRHILMVEGELFQSSDFSS